MPHKSIYLLIKLIRFFEFYDEAVCRFYNVEQNLSFYYIGVYIAIIVIESPFSRLLDISVSGEAQTPTIPEVQLTEEEARREREIRIAKKRKTRKAE